jgi:hypothetical protein
VDLTVVEVSRHQCNVEEERVHGVNLVAVGEVVGEDPMTVEAWGGRGVGGHAGGGEMVPTGLGFKGQSCDKKEK